MKNKGKSKRGGKRAGAGRKPVGNGPGVTVSATVPEEYCRAIDEDRGEKTRSEFLRELVSRWFKKR